ncbi:lactonase family protein [Polaribacter sp. Hel_I_88]|uniref:lactonase family protein n=1 Tax=Polaribacter sp. Hel_I_88 TaxID=1250006 RepID=UPI0004787C19|nr:lactonase family protein [Polaribacter sp. Hel_I_88]
MKKISMLIVISLFFSCSMSKIKEEKASNFYVGTYTDGESEGIYKYQINADGKLKQIGLVAKTNNPSYLAKTKDNKTLLAVDETNENGTGFVNSFRIEKDSLVFVSKSQSGGTHPCFVSINDDNQVLVANYSGGNVGILEIDNQSGLTNLLAVQQHVGNTIHPKQQKPHAHFAKFHPTKNEIIAVDLGTNQLWFSAFDELKNELQFTNQKTLNMNVGAGPRHFTFHPNNKWLYVVNELNNTVSLVKEKENLYVIDQTIAMLPKDFKNYSKAADIHISKDGQFVYASNRGYESIVIYKIHPENGTLKLVGFQDVKGKHPRNFSLSPDDNFLLVANKDSNNIVSFKRDNKSGKLTFVDEIFAPNPVCVLF